MRRGSGFTLVEVMVAIGVLALLALMGWRGLETLLRTREGVDRRMSEVAQLQTGLAQWRADLEAMISMGSTPAMDFDGLVLRITRTDPASPGQALRVVAWSRRAIPGQHAGRGSWVRWQSSALANPQELAQAWMQAQIWARNPSQADLASDLAIVGIEGWQLLYFRNNSWSNPLSADDVAAGGQVNPAPVKALPGGVRLVLRLSAGTGLRDSLVYDWAAASDTQGRP